MINKHKKYKSRRVTKEIIKDIHLHSEASSSTDQVFFLHKNPKSNNYNILWVRRALSGNIELGTNCSDYKAIDLDLELTDIIQGLIKTTYSEIINIHVASLYVHQEDAEKLIGDDLENLLKDFE